MGDPSDVSIDLLAEAEKLVESSKRIGVSAALLAEFVHGAAEAWVIVDPRGRIALFNEKASFLFGWRPEEVLGQPVEVLLPEVLRARHAAVHRAGFNKNPYPRPMGHNIDLQAQHRDGSTFPVLIDLHPKVGDGGTYVRAAIRPKPDPAPPVDPV